MKSLVRYFQRTLIGVVCALAVASAQAQTKPSPSPEQDDVIRVNTELVQTDVMVFDKKGHFVDGLKAEQFALRVDNKPQTISFFDRVTSGKATTASNGAAASGGSSSNPGNTPTATIQGRTVIFYVDDLHLAPDSLSRTRKALTEFIDRGMSEDDQVAITSSSGQIGFLQQLSNDRVALRSAVARLNYRTSTKLDMDKPPMSEYIAMKIRDGDEATIGYYITELQKQNCFRASGELICTMSPQALKMAVRERAQEMVTMATPATDNTLIMLENLMRMAAQLPGRKIVFMVSDGFYLNDRKSGSMSRIKRITDAAGRAGVVINTLDARGIISEMLGADNPSPIAEGASMNIGEVMASQDGLNALAGDTGGRAFRNTNAPMAEFVDKVLDETANYYLLAWRPDSDEQKRGKFNHIEGSIIGRPELTVRLRTTYFKTAPLPILSLKKKSDKDPEQAREDDMRLVIDAPVSQTQIPTVLELSLSQMPGVGTQVTATIQISREALNFALNDGKQSSDLDIGGIFYNDKGKPLNSFVGRLRVFPVPENAPVDRRAQAVYAFHAWLPAGLYQVRVGVRDTRSGRIGSAMQWIDVPKVVR
jgi:VWFA-related protein